jgi:Caspase domain
MRIVIVVALTALAMLLAVMPGYADKRVALVIGNDRYPNLPRERQLAKAANDAQAVGDALVGLGFQVIRGTNLGRQEMIDKLSELAITLAPGDTAAFFYAGHGVAIGGVNYLVPSDVPPVTPDGELRVRGASIAEGDVVAELQNRGVRVALLILDACRDNPFPRSATRAIGDTRGLTNAKTAFSPYTPRASGKRLSIVWSRMIPTEIRCSPAFLSSSSSAPVPISAAWRSRCASVSPSWRSRRKTRPAGRSRTNRPPHTTIRRSEVASTSPGCQSRRR